MKWANRRWLGRGATFLSTLLAIGLFLYFRESPLDREIARIKAKGEPTTWEELTVTDATADQLAACDELIAIGRELSRDPSFHLGGQYATFWPFGPGDAPIEGKPWKEQALARRCLEERSALIQRMRSAFARKPARRLALGPDSVPQSAIDSWETGSLFRLAQLNAAVQIRDGHDVEWGQAINDLIDLVECMATSALMTDHFKAYAFASSAAPQIEDGLCRVSRDTPSLDRLQRRLGAIDLRPSLRTTLVECRVSHIALATYAFPLNWKKRSVNEWLTIRLKHSRPAAMSIPFTSQVLDHMNNEWPEIIDFVFGESVGPDDESLKLALATENPNHFTSRSVFAACRTQARLRVAETAIAIRRFQLKHHHSPASLAAMVPDFLASVPIDPFDGKPIRYQTGTNSGDFKVYSVGSDRRDDHSNGGESGDWPDIVMTVRPVLTATKQSSFHPRQKTP